MIRNWVNNEEGRNKTTAEMAVKEKEWQ